MLPTIVTHPSSAESSPLHLPVMCDSILQWLRPATGQVMVDATLGLGGHAVELLRAVGPEGCVIGLDRDPEALRRAGERLRAAAIAAGWSRCPFIPCHRDFRHLGEALDKLGIVGVHGVLLDLGVSSMQLDFAERGFSFRSEGPLDMRMNPTEGDTAADLVNSLPEGELADLIFRYGEERLSRRIARRIVERRPLHTTRELADAVWSAYPADQRHGRIHPATRTFQALRIAVNDELEAIQPALYAAAERLLPGGRLAVLAYHSLEDRLVKHAFEWLSGRCRCAPELPECRCQAQRQVSILTRKPVEPSAEEVELNPRARSARLRVVERLPADA